MQLQLALDFMELGEARNLLERVSDLIDIAEVGTPLIMKEGIRAVRELREEFPSSCILADLKIIDGGGYESGLVFEAGADIVTVLGLADDVTIQAVVSQAQAQNKKVMADMIGIKETGKRAGELDRLSVDYLCAHTAFDVRFDKNKALAELREIKKVVKHAKTAVAGGITVQNIHLLVPENPEIVVVGSALTKSRNIRETTLKMKKLMYRLR
jgi:3-hexulose-6-phosphate synthase